MSYTVAEARTRLGTDLLDDPDSRRRDSTALDRHLRAALSHTYSSYVSHGGTRFQDTIEATTDSSGLLDLSAYDPAQIDGVRIKLGIYYERVPATRPQDRQQSLNAQQTLDVTYSPTPEFDASPTSNLLVGFPSTNADIGSWDAFDELVCLEAAASALSIRGGKIPQGILDLRETLRESVHARRNNPRTRRLPGLERRWAYDLSYFFDKPAKTIQLHRRINS